MPSFVSEIKMTACRGLKAINPEISINPENITINEVSQDFEGDFAVVLFPFLKQFRMSPNDLGTKLGGFLKKNDDKVADYSVVKGFLNLTLSDDCLKAFLEGNYQNKDFGQKAANGQKVMVEYSSPNTNKPIHFGHLRNIFLGWAMSEILKYRGFEVIKANLVNDRGIHICKSMVAWQLFGQGKTPESTGIKGDHLVGNYYVQFNNVYQQEIKELIKKGMPEKEAKTKAPLFLEAQEMLRRWEKGDAEVRHLWQKMNDWVFDGFDKTYADLGVDFDKTYYESDTYLLGKEMVDEGLKKGILFKKDNGSVWIDLTEEGFDQKLLLRSDGTSVYMTQDLGTARLKYNDYGMNQSVYVIADEQNYHMDVLKLILKKLGEPCAKGIFHLSYGMVELPSGKMKSREGTVVDADDMIADMEALAGEQTEESGKTEDFNQQELQGLYKTIGLGALKFYLLRVDPKKKMVFDPKKSIDLHGFTASFVQYSYARINSIMRKVSVPDESERDKTEDLLPLEKELLLKLEGFPLILDQTIKEYNPAVICNYAFQLAHLFNSFFDQHSVIRAESNSKKRLRLKIAHLTQLVLDKSLSLLGIGAPERM